MQTLEEKEGQTGDKVASPPTYPSLSLSQFLSLSILSFLLCAKLQIDSRF